MKLGQTQLSLIQLCDEQKKDRTELDKLRRQRDQLQSLCKLFEKDKTKYRDDANLLLEKVREFVPDFKVPETRSSASPNNSVPSTSDMTSPCNSPAASSALLSVTRSTAAPDITATTSTTAAAAATTTSSSLTASYLPETSPEPAETSCDPSLPGNAASGFWPVKLEVI